MTRLWGVGDERARQLARLDIATVEDLLLHRPRRYEDRRKFLSIRELQLGEAATVRGKIIAAGVKRWRKGERAMFECVIDDGTAHLHCRWWQAQPWMEEYFLVGREFLAFGKPESLRPRTMDHPETEWVEPGEESFIHFNRIVPIYPLTEGLPQRWLRGLMWRTLERHEAAIAKAPWEKLQVASCKLPVEKPPGVPPAKPSTFNLQPLSCQRAPAPSACCTSRRL